MTIKNTDLAKKVEKRLADESINVDFEMILNGLDAERTPAQEETEELTQAEINELVSLHVEAIKCEIEEQ